MAEASAGPYANHLHLVPDRYLTTDVAISVVYISVFVAVCAMCSSDCAVKQPSAEAQDDAVAKRLWDVSVELVHLHDSEIHAALRQSA